MKKFILLFSVLCADYVHAEISVLHVIQECPDDIACLEMSINFGKNYKGENPNLSKLYDEYQTTYMMFDPIVKGRLNNRKNIKQIIRFVAYIDGLICSDFGQGEVAVVGFSKKQNPIILTDKGNLEITDGSIAVGCSVCAKVSNRNNPNMDFNYIIPGDFTGIAHKKESVGFDYDNGYMFLIKKDKCIKVERDALFSIADMEKCKSMELKIDYLTDHYEKEGTPYFLWFKTSTCH